MRMGYVTIAVGLAFWPMAKEAQASLLITITQSSSGVTENGTGSLDVTGLYNAGTYTNDTAFIDPVDSQTAVGDVGSRTIYYVFYNAFVPYGTGGYINASSGAGSLVGFTPGTLVGSIFVPPGYTSGSQINSSAFYAVKLSLILG